jgi:hypothetical protein
MGACMGSLVCCTACGSDNEHSPYKTREYNHPAGSEQEDNGQLDDRRRLHRLLAPESIS